MKTITKNIALFIITLGILSSPFSAHAATWVGPTDTPPGNNVSAPVNVGPFYQIKVGDLGLFSLFANYIKSLGTISANRYCFNGGTAGAKDTNCITSWPTGGTGGIESIVAGTNVTVDNTDPLNPIVSSTGGTSGADLIVKNNGTTVSPVTNTLNFTGPNVSAVGTNGVVSVSVTPNKITKDGILVHGWANTLNFTGNNITTTNNNGIVSVGVAPATPTAVLKDSIQVSAAPLALDFTGNNISATNTNGVVKIVVAPATPTAIQKDGIQVSAAPLALNFLGDNITATNTNGVVSVGVNKLTVQKDGINVGAGNNFKGINFNFNGTSGWDIQNSPDGIAQVNYYGDGSAGEFLPAATPADKILRSDGNDWVQSPLVKTTVSSFQVNRPIADNSTQNIFSAAKMYNVLGTPMPLTGLFVTQQGDTYVNGAKFRNYYNGGTTATPANSFGSDDIFQVTTNASNTGNGLAVRGDAKVRVAGTMTPYGGSNGPTPLSAGLFLASNDIFQVVGDLNGVKRGFALDTNGTTRVEGMLAINGSLVHFGTYNHNGDTMQTGNNDILGTLSASSPTSGLALEVNGRLEQNDGDYILTNGNINQTGGNYNLTGNINQTGNISQTGNYSIQGNISQTGNINTSGRWAVADDPGWSPSYYATNYASYYSNNPSYGGQPIPYSFLASVGNGGSSGSLGINRAGQTRIVGQLRISGPASLTGNLTVDGSIQSDTLASNDGNRHVCADISGKLKLCDYAIPLVSITSTSLSASGDSFTENAQINTSTISNPNKSVTVTYTISGVDTGTSCTRSTNSGSTSGWNGSFSPTIPNDTDNITINVTSFGPTELKVSCVNGTGQMHSDTRTIYGHGSWQWIGTGTRSMTFPASTSLTMELVGAGASGGASYIGGSDSACGGGGGAGQYATTSGIASGTYNITLAVPGDPALPNSDNPPNVTGGAHGEGAVKSTIKNLQNTATILYADGGFWGYGGTRTEMYPGYALAGGAVAYQWGAGGSNGGAGAICLGGAGKTPWTYFGTTTGFGGRGGNGGSVPNGISQAGFAGGVRVSW